MQTAKLAGEAERASPRCPGVPMAFIQGIVIACVSFDAAAGPLLANSLTVHRERPALVFSVTSEVAASASLQVAPPKPALPDPAAQASDDFGALVDSNLPAAPPPPPASPAPSRSATSDNPPPANTPPSRDASASSDKQPANNDNDPPGSAQPGDTSAAGSADGAPKTGTKSRTSDSKSSDKAAT